MDARVRWLSLFCLLPLSSSGCNQPFDPKGPLDKQMVIFCVLSTDRKVHFVRVERSYMPSEYDPTAYNSDNAVTDAQVIINGAGKYYQMRDTVLPRPDTSRYKFPLHVYVVNPLAIANGKAYGVSVQSPCMGAIYATTLVPDKGYITLDVSAYAILVDPTRLSANTPIDFFVQLSPIAKGYIGRFIICYDVVKNNEWVEEHVEVPVPLGYSTFYGPNVPLYPQMTRCPSTNRAAMQYQVGQYLGVIDGLRNGSYARNRLSFKWAVLRLVQVEQNLYKYYTTVHAFQDPYSIRLDEPLFSGIKGGEGVVGAYTLDSLVFLYPENFFGNQ